MFDLISDLSPWWWVAFGIALGAIEMATMSFFLIWPALAALAMAAVAYLFPGLPGEGIISIWAILSILLTFVGRSFMARFGDGGEPVGNLNNRSKSMIGRQAKVLTWEQNEGAIEIDGMRWKAEGEHGGSFVSDTPVFVIDAQGMTLIVRS